MTAVKGVHGNADDLLKDEVKDGEGSLLHI
jgi:hypothetical protein